MIVCFNDNAYNDTSSINFYTWNVLIPTILDLLMLFDCASYYNKYFHKNEFLKYVGFCYEKPKIQRILLHTTFTLGFCAFLMVLIIVIPHTTGTLVTCVVFIAIFALIGLFLSISFAVILFRDVRINFDFEKMTKEEKTLVVFAVLVDVMFIMIFLFQFLIAVLWNLGVSNASNIIEAQLSFEFLMIFTVLSMMTYIYGSYIIPDFSESESDAAQISDPEMGPSVC